MKQTSVYVTGLPYDVTIDELATHFSRAGIILDDMISGGPRIKLYDKGDALVVYLREESVGLACQILDDSPLRPGLSIHVEPAQFDYESKDKEPLENAPVEASARISKNQWKKKMDKMQSKLAWEEEGAEGARAFEKRLKNECTALLYNMFTQDELEADPGMSIDIEEDVRSEATRIGAVKSVTILDYELCVAVRFHDRQSAAQCVRLMDGRWYGGKKIRASLYDGSFKIKAKSDAIKVDEEDLERLEKFGEWLEQEG